MKQKIDANGSLRFLGVIKQSDPDPGPGPGPGPDAFELEESDVVWSPDENSEPPAAFVPPVNHRIQHEYHQFRPDKSGLSAALTEDHHSLVRRKSNLNPSVAARKVAPIRSESFSGGKFHQSAPVNVPVWGKKIGESRKFDQTYEYDDDDEFNGKMVPPHEIVARSHVTFSVFEGVGRTLKGRDLRRVRNAVFQRTGFIDG